VQVPAGDIRGGGSGFGDTGKERNMKRIRVTLGIARTPAPVMRCTGSTRIAAIGAGVGLASNVASILKSRRDGVSAAERDQAHLIREIHLRTGASRRGATQS
jgi:hypothetical protein